MDGWAAGIENQSCLVSPEEDEEEAGERERRGISSTIISPAIGVSHYSRWAITIDFPRSPATIQTTATPSYSWCPCVCQSLDAATTKKRRPLQLHSPLVILPLTVPF